MIAIDFLRHGETTRPGALLGRTDAPLADTGRRSIERQVAGRTWQAVVSSPLRRARESAEAIAATLGLPLEVEPDWAEIDFGDWDGQEIAALRADPATASKLGAVYADPTTLVAPNGETYREVEARVRRALYALAARDGTVLVMAHGGTIRTALSLALPIPLASLWSLRIDCATRVRVNLGIFEGHGLWGEITEIAQP